MRFFSQLRTTLTQGAASLHDPNFYRQSFAKGQGAGVVYLISIISVAWVIVALWQAFLFGPNSALNAPVQFLRAVAPHFPEVAIESGKVKLDKPQPYVIADQASGDPLMIIDTSGQTPNLDNQNAAVLLTRTALFIRMEDKIDEYTIPAEANGHINGDSLLSLADKWQVLMPYAPFIALPANIVVNFLSFLGRWLILGAVVFLALSPRIKNVTPERALRIAAHALTASVLLNMAIYGLQIPLFHSPEFMQTMVGFLYVLFATYAIAGRFKPKSK